MFSNNNAQSSKWVATCHGMDGVLFKAVNFILPASHLGQTDLGGGGHVSYIIAGDHITYDPLDIDFLIDDDYKNYQMMFEWMHDIIDSADFSSVTKTITLHLLNNYSEFSDFCVDFSGCYITDLGVVPLENTNDTTDLQCSAILNYERMTIRRCCVPISDLS